jgi:hypothetical protein
MPPYPPVPIKTGPGCTFSWKTVLVSLASYVWIQTWRRHSDAKGPMVMGVLVTGSVVEFVAPMMAMKSSRANELLIEGKEADSLIGSSAFG